MRGPGRPVQGSATVIRHGEAGAGRSDRPGRDRLTTITPMGVVADDDERAHDLIARSRELRQAAGIGIGKMAAEVGTDKSTISRGNAARGSRSGASAEPGQGAPLAGDPGRPGRDRAARRGVTGRRGVCGERLTLPPPPRRRGAA